MREKENPLPVAVKRQILVKEGWDPCVDCGVRGELHADCLGMMRCLRCAKCYPENVFGEELVVDEEEQKNGDDESDQLSQPVQIMVDLI